MLVLLDHAPAVAMPFNAQLLEVPFSPPCLLSFLDTYHLVSQIPTYFILQKPHLRRTMRIDELGVLDSAVVNVICGFCDNTVHYAV